MISLLYHKIKKYSYLVTATILLSIIFVSCSSDSTETTKEERRAVKKGNELYRYNKDREEYMETVHDYAGAAEQYAKALESNPNSEIAKLNWAMASLMSNETDSLDCIVADSLMTNLALYAKDPLIARNAMYNQAKVYVDYGDQLSQAAKTEAEQAMGQQFEKQSIEYYEKAIDKYEELLRREPGNLEVTQNLRIVQLKLPENDDQQNQQDQQQQDQQNQQNQQDQQDQENKEQNKKQKEQEQNQPQADALNALQQREAQTMRKQGEPVKPTKGSSRKPW